MALRTSDLTAGERYLIERRRMDLSQAEAAQEWGVSMYEWLQMESSTEKGGPGLGRLEMFEVCLLMRRRAGRTAKSVAKDIGISRYWLSQMERGKAPVDTLSGYWGLS